MMSWKSLKEKGNALYSVAKYEEASKAYTSAIEKLSSESSKTTSVELAKLFSNRSVSKLKLASLKLDERETLLEEAFQDGEMAIKLDPSFFKGYYRCFDVLQAQNRDLESVSFITKLIDMKKLKTVTAARQDKDLNAAMQQCKYYTKVKEDSPNWSKVKFPDSCFVVDLGGAGDFTDVKDAIHLPMKVSVLVKPGVYRTRREPIVVRPGQCLDIVADVTDDEDDVTFFCTGEAFAPDTIHVVAVMSGTLYMNGVTIRQESKHPEMHGILLNNDATAELDNIKCYTKFSPCIAAVKSNLTVRHSTFETCGAMILGGNAEGCVQHCTIKNTTRIGIELRDGGFATIEDTQISGSGMQAVVSHAGGKGFTINRCRFEDNARKMKYEGTVMMSCGHGLVENSQIMRNVAGGIMVDHTGRCEVNKCTISGGCFGLGFSMGGTAHVKDCSIQNATIGVTIIHNLKADVVLENVSISRCKLQLNKTDQDAAPKILGTDMNFNTLIVDMEKCNDKFGKTTHTDMRNAKKKDKYRPPKEGDIYNPILEDPNSKRVCSPCGMTQEIVGHKFKLCSACKSEWYCSKECQLKDWKLHKKECVHLRGMTKAAKK